MTDKISFDLVSPERLLLSEDAEMVTIPGTEGDMGVMAGHMPLISTLRPGLIDVKGGTEGDIRFYVLGGFAEITGTKMTVLAEEAVPMSELDRASLDKRITAAEQDFLLAPSDNEKMKAQATLNYLISLRTAL
jgi:F-type H+-transporting ATPase subunit epsilon